MANKRKAATQEDPGRASDEDADDGMRPLNTVDMCSPYREIPYNQVIRLIVRNNTNEKQWFYNDAGWRGSRVYVSEPGQRSHTYVDRIGDDEALLAFPANAALARRHIHIGDVGHVILAHGKYGQPSGTRNFLWGEGRVVHIGATHFKVERVGDKPAP